MPGIRRAEKDIREYVLSSSTKEELEHGTGDNKGVSGNAEIKVVREAKGGTDKFLNSSTSQGANINIVSYLGIAADEPERIARHQGRKNIKLPLVEAGWTEAMCREWCEKNNLLSPIYTTATRGGCWFCHNQGIDQLRLLRKNYPNLWALLMKWDNDSPVSFHPPIKRLDGTIEPGKTVHDFDRRFALENMGLVPKDRTFKWQMVDDAILLLGPNYEEVLHDN